MTLAGYLAVLRRRFLVVVLCIAAGVAGGLLQVHRTPKMYAATATYFVSLPGSSGSNADVQQNAVNVAQSFLLSFQDLATKRSTADAVSQSLGVSSDQVAGHLSSEIEAGTFYIDVTATDTDPDEARVLANAAAQTVTQLIPKIQGTSKNQAGASVTDLALLPSAPYQPQPGRTIGLGGVLGLVAGLALTAILEALDRSTRSSGRAAEIAGAPILGSVLRRKAVSDGTLVVADAQREPYRSLRAAVNFLNPDDPPVTIMITSAGPGDGKSTTSANLATTMAEAGAQVLLVDADLRRGTLSRSLEVRRASGATSVITKDAQLADVVVNVGSLFFLPCGPTPPNPSELLGSQSAVDMLASVRARFDVVIIDAPPVLAVSDALALAPHVDAVVLVVRHGRTARAGLAEASRRLTAVGRKPVGIVYNDVPRRESTDYYGTYIYVES